MGGVTTFAGVVESVGAWAPGLSGAGLVWCRVLFPPGARGAWWWVRNSCLSVSRGVGPVAGALCGVLGVFGSFLVRRVVLEGGVAPGAWGCAPGGVRGFFLWGTPLPACQRRRSHARTHIWLAIKPCPGLGWRLALQPSLHSRHPGFVPFVAPAPHLAHVPSTPNPEKRHGFVTSWAHGSCFSYQMWMRVPMRSGVLCALHRPAERSHVVGLTVIRVCSPSDQGSGEAS